MGELGALRLRGQGLKYREIAARFGSEQSTIRQAIINKWKHLPNSQPLVNPRKLTYEAAAQIRKLHAAGQTYEDLAAQFGVKPHTIDQVIRGERWSPERWAE